MKQSGIQSLGLACRGFGLRVATNGMNGESVCQKDFCTIVSIPSATEFD